ncbi:MAG: sugar phosphate isomerase/epimerase [Clostridia bacterium]|nr:sugar phosphate isomerase/epimerase [Clostridia bacterium]
MKIGINSGSFSYLNTIEAQYARIAALGYDAVDQDLADTNAPCYRSDDAMKEHCLGIRRAAEETGLEICQVHGPWPTDDKTPENRAQTLIHMRRAVYGCHVMGSRYLIIHPQMPYGWGAEEDPEFAYRLTVDLMKALMPDCEKYGVVLCLENMPMTAHRISTMDRIAEAVREVNSPFCGICLDTGHTNVFGRDPGEDVRIAGTLLKTLHVHDNDGRGDHHLLPWLGCADWNSFTAALGKSSFDGVLSMETAGVRRPSMPENLLTLAETLTAETARTLASMADSAKS